MATVFTTAGEQFVVDKLRTAITDPTQAKFTAWGTGSTTAAKGQTALVAEASEARVAGTPTSPSASVYQSIGQITAAGTKSIAEAGLFTASAAGTMVIRADFTAVPVLAADSIEFTWTLTFS